MAKSRSSTLRVRRAKVRDAKVVARLMQESFAEYRRGKRGPKGAYLKARQVRYQLKKKKKRYALAQANEKNVGVIGYKLRNDRLVFGPLGVIPRYRRRGVGRVLLRWVEARARAKKCGAVQAQVLQGLDHLVNFYEKNGYEKVLCAKGRTYVRKSLR